MYTAQDALDDLFTIDNAYDRDRIDLAVVQLRTYLEEQKFKENIPQLLRTKNGTMYPENQT